MEAIEWASQIDIIEYDSGRPGDLLFVTSGMHGEETLGELAAENLDDEMKGFANGIDKGKVLLLPRINTYGCKNKTRYVFPDEADTDLNKVFDQYETGGWEEFLGLKSKTAKYGWLLMKYLTGEHSDHKNKFGEEHQARLIDLHRDDATAIPYNRIDRMHEDPETLARLFNAFRTIHVPLILEDRNWEAKYAHSLSAAATANGISACTIEEGKTSDPDQFAQPYISHEIMQYLVDKGIVIVDLSAWSDQTDLISSLYEISAIARSRQLAEYIAKEGRIFSFDYREGSYSAWQTGQEQSAKGILAHAASSAQWDGFITVAFNVGLRGLSATAIGGEGSPIRGLANIVFGKNPGNFAGTLDRPYNMVIYSGLIED